MSNFSKASEILKKSNVNNVLEKNLNNDINVNSKYALDKTKFKPNTEEALLAEEISEHFNDLNNYAAYFSVVKSLGIVGAKQFWKEVMSDIEEKKSTKYPVRSPRKYFMWKFKRKHKN